MCVCVCVCCVCLCVFESIFDSIDQCSTGGLTPGQLYDAGSGTCQTVRVPDTAALPATIEIALAAEHARFREILAERPGVLDVQASGRFATLSLHGCDADHAALLGALVEAGLPVARFAARGRNLEDAFLHLTKGQVQ